MLVVEGNTAHAPGCENGAILCGGARARARSALHDVLPANVFADSFEQNAYAMHLEACAAAYSGNDYGTYMSMMSRVVYNMSSNGEYIIRTYPISKVCKLSHKRLRAETAHAQRDAVTEKRLQTLLKRVEQEVERASKTASSIHTDAKIKCPKCKATDDITRVLAQLRRGDEGMTTRCMCKCGYTWNMAS